MLNLHRGTRAAGPPERIPAGLSLVELMVGVTVGMIVIGGALTLYAHNIAGSRQLLLEARLNEDLRAAADLVARDLRRSGYWGNAIAGTVAVPGGAMPQNPYADVTASSGQLTYEFSRDATENNTLDSAEQFGFRLSGGALQMQTSSGNWSEVTNSQAVTITGLTITPTTTILPLGHLCAKTCAVGTPGCPTVAVRSYAVLLRGQAVADDTIRRDLRSNVRLRNERLAGTCPA